MLTLIGTFGLAAGGQRHRREGTQQYSSHGKSPAVMINPVCSGVVVADA
ncbi:hypothetical protein [Stenotrophomonas sp.]|nr:hypothetical protein [Stenotrophomonas sp.]MDX3933940.1 hypothetical protein [Stenotrophomonas sp.]